MPGDISPGGHPPPSEPEPPSAGAPDPTRQPAAEPERAPVGSSQPPAAVRPLDTALLERAAAELGLGDALTPPVVAQLERFAAEMLRWNERVNLTRITGPGEIAILHVVDSLVCLRGVGDAGIPGRPLSCIDVGAGAGLPGIALQLARPTWRVTLVEAVGKKAAFLSHVTAVLDLDTCTVLHARAEDVARQAAHRAAYDVAVARAVAALPVLAEYLLPLVRVGGRMLALKGDRIEDELAALTPALSLLGGRLTDVVPYRLPGIEHPRHLVVVDKVAPTPEVFPRRAGEPARAPLTAAWRPPPGRAHAPRRARPSRHGGRSETAKRNRRGD